MAKIDERVFHRKQTKLKKILQKIQRKKKTHYQLLQIIPVEPKQNKTKQIKMLQNFCSKNIFKRRENILYIFLKTGDKEKKFGVKKHIQDQSQ